MKNRDFTNQLGEYFDVFLLDIKCAKPNTISSYADSFAILFEFFYEQKKKTHTTIAYKDFTPQLFDEYILWLKNSKGYADSSIHPRFSALVSFLKYASRRNMSALHAYSAVVGAEIPKTYRTEFPYFSLDETKILLKLPNPNRYLGDRDLVLLSFLYETAARAQEVCDLHVKDIRFGSPTKVKLTGKGGKVREIPIAPDVSDLLRYHIKRHGLNSPAHRSDSLFASQTNEKMTRLALGALLLSMSTWLNRKTKICLKRKTIRLTVFDTVKRFIWQNLEHRLFISATFSDMHIFPQQKYMPALGRLPLQKR